MIDYAKNLQRREQFGAVRMHGEAGAWALRLAGGTVAVLTTDELDELAQGLAFRLEVRDVVATPAGVEGLVGENAAVHLSYADNAEWLASRVMDAASRNGVTV